MNDLRIKSKKSGFGGQSGLLLLVIVVIGNLILLYFTITDPSFLWLTIGAFVFITLPAVYNLFTDFSNVEIFENNIVFYNTYTSKRKSFLYSDITLFKSYLLQRSIGPRGGTYAGESYNVLDIEFGEVFSIQLSDNNYVNFTEMKLFIHSKINSN